VQGIVSGQWQKCGAGAAIGTDAGAQGGGCAVEAKALFGARDGGVEHFATKAL